MDNTEYIKDTSLAPQMNLYDVLANITSRYSGVKLLFGPEKPEQIATFVFHYDKIVGYRSYDFNQAIEQMIQSSEAVYDEIAKKFKEKTGKSCPLKFLKNESDCQLVGTNGKYRITIKITYLIKDPTFKLEKDFVETF